MVNIEKIVRSINWLSNENVEKRKFRKELKDHKGGPLKIVIGSSGVFESDWIPSEAHFLNLLDEDSWRNYFKENEIDGLLAEHVWEHLTEKEGEIAARTCHKFLRRGGWLRVAVPDGFHENKEYVESVKPGGYGSGAEDHKVLYDYKSLSSVFQENGFRVKLLEYFDEKNCFHSNNWDKEKGFIRRSVRYDKRNQKGEVVYTSLIIDAIKI